MALSAVARRLSAEGLRNDVAWSRVMCPPGALALDDVDPIQYSHVVFVCGPLHGQPIQELREQFAHCRFLAVDVTVFPDDPLTGAFDAIVARDGFGVQPQRDLAALVPTAPVPVVGVFLTEGQSEYASQRRHDYVASLLEEWLAGRDAARLSLETRLDPRDWRLPHTPDQVTAVVRRLDLVVTMRMHGLVLGLGAGTPVLAVDPIADGGKVSAQAEAWGWPAVLRPEELSCEGLDRWWDWCLGAAGRVAAAKAADRPADHGQLDELVAALTCPN